MGILSSKEFADTLKPVDAEHMQQGLLKSIKNLGAWEHRLYVDHRLLHDQDSAAVLSHQDLAADRNFAEEVAIRGVYAHQFSAHVVKGAVDICRREAVMATLEHDASQLNKKQPLRRFELETRQKSAQLEFAADLAAWNHWAWAQQWLFKDYALNYELLACRLKLARMRAGTHRVHVQGAQEEIHHQEPSSTQEVMLEHARLVGAIEQHQIEKVALGLIFMDDGSAKIVDMSGARSCTADFLAHMSSQHLQDLCIAAAAARQCENECCFDFFANRRGHGPL
jgi:hypothetical protein